MAMNRLTNLESAIGQLPDTAMVPVGWIRQQLYPEQDSAVVDEMERTIRMWEEKVTRDLCRDA